MRKTAETASRTIRVVPGVNADFVSKDARNLDNCVKTAHLPVETVDYFHFSISEKIRLLDRARKEAEICRDRDRRDMIIAYSAALSDDVAGYVEIVRM